MKRSRLKLGKDEYKRLSNAVLHRDKYKCRFCKTRNNLHVHHIVYRSQGGDDVDSNLCVLCDHCHDGIHRPNPSNGAMLLILPVKEGETVDANGVIIFHAVNGFKPRRAA